MKKFENSKKIIIYLSICIFFILNIMFVLFFNDFRWYFQLINYVFNITLLVLTVIFYLKNNKSAVRIIFIINICYFIFIVITAILKCTGTLQQFSSVEKIKALISRHKGWSYVIFCLLEILNIVILPIPAILLHIAGASLFGSWVAFLLAFLSVFIGSVFVFSIGRIFGKKVVNWCIGKKSTEKYRKILNKKGEIAFIFMQILPFFPDDVLCFVAGISNMSWKFFILIMLTIRPIYIILACFFGTGQIIPFSGWGIPVWICVVGVTIILFVIYSKNNDKIEKWILNFKKRKYLK